MHFRLRLERIPGMIDRKTIFSPCRKYRYTLWREWDAPEDLLERVTKFKFGQYVQFIGLNPSTADEVKNDPTVTRCINYAKAWGFGAMCMTNAFAWRDTDPKGMKTCPKPISHSKRMEEFRYGIKVDIEENDYWIDYIASQAGLVIAAWGKHGKHLGRDEEIKSLGIDLYCLGTNIDGTPKHPLYLAATATPIPFSK